MTWPAMVRQGREAAATAEAIWWPSGRPAMLGRRPKTRRKARRLAAEGQPSW